MCVCLGVCVGGEGVRGNAPLAWLLSQADHSNCEFLKKFRLRDVMKFTRSLMSSIYCNLQRPTKNQLTQILLSMV